MTPLLRRRAKNMMEHILTPNCIQGGIVTRDPLGVEHGGGFDKDIPESAHNWLLFHTIFTQKDCLAGSTLYSSATLRGEHKGTTPRGAPPHKIRH